MKPGDSLEALMAEAVMGTCGHPRQFNPYRPDDMLPCATPGCRWGNEAPVLNLRPPISWGDEAPNVKPVHRLERAEAMSGPELMLGDSVRWEGRRFWLWRFA